MRRAIAALIIGAALLAPAAGLAKDEPPRRPPVLSFNLAKATAKNVGQRWAAEWNAAHPGNPAFDVGVWKLSGGTIQRWQVTVTHDVPTAGPEIVTESRSRTYQLWRGSDGRPNWRYERGSYEVWRSDWHGDPDLG